MKASDFDEGGRFGVGRVVQAKNASYEALRTEPPTRFTQSDLIDEMMAAHKYATNDRDRGLLRQISGLGTSRTRESTITGLVEKGFLEEHRSKKSRTRVELKPTEMAMAVIAALPKMLTDPATTAKWELAFQMVESGKAKSDDVHRYFTSMLNDVVQEAKGLGTLKLPAQQQAGKNPFGKKTA